MKNDFQTKIEETLNSLHGIQRAEANPFLLTRVLDKVQSGASGFVKPALIWQTAIVFIIILTLNIGIGMYSSNNTQKDHTSSEAGYFSNHQYNY
jgi:hypothetical protein